MEGKYYNGITPVSILVRCEILTDKIIVINSKTNEIIAEWKKEDIYQDEIHNTAIVFGNRVSLGKIELIKNDIPADIGFEIKSVINSSPTYLIKWIGFILLLIVGVWQLIPLGTKFIASRIPIEFEKKFAAKLPIEKQFKVCNLNAEEKRALTVYKDFLYPKNDFEKQLPLTILVANDPIINAYTFPGGIIVIEKALLNDLKSPEELLGIMAHEIGHVTGRDGMSLMVRGTFLASFFTYLTGDYNSSFAVSPKIFLSTAVLSIDRDVESHADAFASRRLNLVNVSTSGLRSFLSRRNSETGQYMPEILMTHPDYLHRMNLINETYPKVDLPKDIEDSWYTIKHACESK